MTVALGAAVSYSTGRARAGEGDVILKPLNYLYGADTMGVVYCHGSNRTAIDTLNRGEPSTSDFVQTIATQYPTIVTDLGGGTTWGNATAQTRIDEAIAALRTATGCNASTFFLAGVSMGGIASFNYARANPLNVAAIVAAIPVCNLTEIYTTTADAATGNTVMKNAIATAWGVTAPASLPAGADPYLSPGELTGVPIRYWYGDSDPLILPASAAAFATATGATASPVVGGHGDSTVGNVPQSDVLAFLAAYAV